MLKKSERIVLIKCLIYSYKQSRILQAKKIKRGGRRGRGRGGGGGGGGRGCGGGGGGGGVGSGGGGGGETLRSETQTIIHSVRTASGVEGVYFAPTLRRAIKRYFLVTIEAYHLSITHNTVC